MYVRRIEWVLNELKPELGLMPFSPWGEKEWKEVFRWVGKRGEDGIAVRYFTWGQGKIDCRKLEVGPAVRFWLMFLSLFAC